MLTLQAVTKIKAELEGAFKPLHCIAQVYDTGQKLRFKVFDRDLTLLAKWPICP